jgi:hypothetical protein
VHADAFDFSEENINRQPKGASGGKGGQFAKKGTGGVSATTKAVGIKKLSDDQIKAVKDYSEGAVDWNEFLRHGAETTEQIRGGWATVEEFQRGIDNLQSAIEASELPEDTVVYRGARSPAQLLGVNDIEDTVGKQFTDRGFVSATTKDSTGAMFASHSQNPALLVMDLPKGTKALNMSAVTGDISEAELLLGQGCRFEITKVVPDAVEYERYTGNVAKMPLVHVKLIEPIGEDQTVSRSRIINGNGERGDKFTWSPGDIVVEENAADQGIRSFLDLDPDLRSIAKGMRYAPPNMWRELYATQARRSGWASPQWGDAGTSEGVKKSWEKRKRAAPEEPKTERPRRAGIWTPPENIKGEYAELYVKAQLEHFTQLATRNVIRLQDTANRTLDPEDRHRANAAEFVMEAIDNARMRGKDALSSIDIGPDGNPVAAAMLNTRDGEIAWVGSIERGHGKAVMKDLLQKAKSAGFKEVSLHSTEEGAPLYTKLGFKRSGKREFGLMPMTLNLAQASLDAAFDALGLDEDVPLLGSDKRRFKEEDVKRDPEGKFAEQAGAKAPTVKPKGRLLPMPKAVPLESIAQQMAVRGPSPVKLTESKVRAWKGVQQQARKLSKQEAGKIGETIALAWIQDKLGLKDAVPVNRKRSNYPVDMVGDHMVFEVKTGQVTNTERATQWRATIGELGQERKAWLKTLPAETQTAYNEQLMEEIMERKELARQQFQKLKGGKEIAAKTLTLILNPDTNTADLYAFDGFHKRLGWKSPETRDAFIGTFQYANRATTGSAGRSGARDTSIFDRLDRGIGGFFQAGY